MAFHSGGNALVVTYDAIEGRFADLPGVRTGHFNAIAGLDIFGDVRSLFVIGRPLPQPTVHRRMAMALTGRPIPAEQPHSETRGQRMTDGSGAAMQVRAYADPDLEALRVAITDNEVLQAAGRGRAVNRTAGDATGAVHPGRRGGADAGQEDRALGGGSPDGAATHGGTGVGAGKPNRRKPALPRSVLQHGSSQEGIPTSEHGTFPYDSLFIGECPSAPLLEGRYRPSGSGPKTRRMWISRWRRLSARADLEAGLGSLRDVRSVRHQFR